MEKNEAYNELCKMVGKCGYYATIRKELRPTIGITKEDGSVDEITAKSLFISNDESSPLKLIDTEDNCWDVHDYLSAEDMKAILGGPEKDADHSTGETMFTKEELEQADVIKKSVGDIIAKSKDTLKDLSMLLLSKCPDNRIEFDAYNKPWGTFTDGFHEAFITSLVLDKETGDIGYAGKVVFDYGNKNIEGRLDILDICDFDYEVVLNSIIGQLKDGMPDND